MTAAASEIDLKYCSLCKESLPKSKFKGSRSNACIDCPTDQRRCRVCDYKGHESHFDSHKWTCKMCLSNERKDKKKGWAGRINSMIKGARNRAARRGRSFGLTNKWLADHLEKINYRCEMTGVKFNLEDEDDEMSLSMGGFYTPSIDRLDNSRGYVEDNVRVISSTVNRMRGAYDDNKFLTFCKAILEHNGYEVTQNRPDYESGDFYSED